MGLQRPGRFRITDKALLRCNLPQGARILDVGCGDGTTVEYLANTYHFRAEGFDEDPKKIDEGKKRNPALNIYTGDTGIMDDLPPATYHAVLMECSLSLIPEVAQTLLQANRLLVEGGYLIIHDLYRQSPVENPPLREDGLFYQVPLLYHLTQTGYQRLHMEDRWEDLLRFVGESILQGDPNTPTCVYTNPAVPVKEMSYFLLVAQKVSNEEESGGMKA